MSLLAAALAAHASQRIPDAIQPAEQQQQQQQQPSAPQPAPAPSPSSATSSLLSLCVKSARADRSLDSASPSPRPNEHLAVLLPKDLWKPDYSATYCDNFFCRLPFSIFERRHHCRKCGGIFCKQCTTKTTALLDASNLAFIHPPRNVPLVVYESPLSPIVNARVCDDCWDQVHGCTGSNGTPRTPEARPSTPVSVCHTPSSASSSTSTSSRCDSPASQHPPRIRNLAVRIRRSASQLSGRPGSGKAVLSPTSDLSGDAAEISYGALDAYPLRHASAVCKALGGGRWVPRVEPVRPDVRIPGGKAPFEIEMEREEEEKRLRRLNPIIRDGEFQYRFPPAPIDPSSVRNGPFQLSTY